MDSTILAAIQANINSEWTYFFSTKPTFQDSSGTTVYAGPAQFMGYAGATFSIFISLIGAFQASTQLVTEVEDGMDNFLEYFGRDDSKVLKDLLKDKPAADNMNNFLRQYTL